MVLIVEDDPRYFVLLPMPGDSLYRNGQIDYDLYAPGKGLKPLVNAPTLTATAIHSAIANNANKSR